ncbi:uncharacterized protein BDR25DRAFT_213316 [Lindgomyces ingoldianus]|uniref:Uncharacterized protein n=1 Tax=Lindgomyces ingoldianus TaxID=673940 RepID=A0ACB6R8N2_9PLEO|nr:uncharacterized protein BDR25DRAFT_213316 [Lindgomyces ingoldianus]KAF2475511.1 hypothetical protein BDR25DRAFT_213316 [Lindgomyces ingoldianus]
MFAPNDLGPTIEITAYTLTSLSTLVVGVRFYCRIWVVGRLKLYDYVMVTALLCTWGMCAINHYQLFYGSGQHPRPPNLPPVRPKLGAARSWYAFQLMYLADLALIKFSILAFYLTIATQRTFRFLVYLSIVIVAVFTIVMIFVNAFECPEHPSFALGPQIFEREKYHCLIMNTVYYTQAGFNIFSDTAILLLPMPLLVQIKSMAKLKRIALLGVFSVGGIAPIASAIRVWGVYMWANSDEPRYYGGYVIFWTQIELNTAIVSASVPSLQPLFKRVFGELSRFPRRSAYYYYGDGAGSHSNMTEAHIGQGRRDVREIPLSGLESPRSSYHPPKQSSNTELESGCIHVHSISEEEEIRARVDISEEEEIRNRVLAFSSQRSSTQSHIPKSPERPRDILMSSG